MASLSLGFPEPLADKYQPKTVEDFAGLDKPKAIMQKFCENPFPSAWLFVGPSGTGKTSMALAICKAIAGELHHIPSQSCDVETIRKVTDMCHRYPYDMMTGQSCKFHIVLVDEADQMSQAAQLALLSKLDSTAYPPKPCFSSPVMRLIACRTAFCPDAGKWSSQVTAWPRQSRNYWRASGMLKLTRRPSGRISPAWPKIQPTTCAMR